MNAHVRKNKIINQLCDIDEKGCGNCNHGKLTSDIFIHCSKFDTTEKPYHCCEHWTRDLKTHLLRIELLDRDLQFRIDYSGMIKETISAQT